MTKLKIVPIEEINKRSAHTMMEVLGIHITKITEDFIEAKMPVDERTRQIFGILHGGASVALAETLGSIGAMLTTDSKNVRCMGIEINANHISSVTEGSVTGIAKPLHAGKSTQVWEIKIHNDANQKLVCVSRLTVAVVPNKN